MSLPVRSHVDDCLYLLDLTWMTVQLLDLTWTIVSTSYISCGWLCLYLLDFTWMAVDFTWMAVSLPVRSHVDGCVSIQNDGGVSTCWLLKR